MGSIDLADYYSGGYFLIRADHPGWPSPFGETLPNKLISLSMCICPKRFSIFWGWIPGDTNAAIEFGIPEHINNELRNWCQSEDNQVMDIESGFRSTDAARKFVAQFVPDKTDLYLIGVGLSKLDQHPWLNDEDDDGYHLPHRLKQQVAIENGGDPIGFEVVSYDGYDFSHSWLCSGLHLDMFDLFGIQINAWGLINSYEDAKTVSDWIAEDEMQGGRAEPEPYDFWLFVEYPLNFTDN